MRILKRIMSLLGCTVIIYVTLCEYKIRNVNAQTNELGQKPVIVDVVLYDLQDKYISLVKQCLEEIKSKMRGKSNLDFTIIREMKQYNMKSLVR